MSVTTVADILNPVVPPDGPVQYPLRGSVTRAYPAEDKNGKGLSQAFTLKDATGEIRVYYYERQGEIYQPVLAGENIEICAQVDGRGKLGGAFKKLSGALSKAPGTPQIYVYGARLSRLNGSAPVPAGAHPASAQPQMPPTWQAAQRMSDGPPSGQAPAATVQAAQQFVRQQPPLLAPTGKPSETEARQLWARNFHALAALFGYPDQQMDLVANLPPHFATLLAAASTTMLIGIQQGNILRDPVSPQGGGFDEELGF